MKNSKLHLPQKLLVLMLSVAMMVTWTVPSMYAFATDEAEGEEQAEVVENVVETEDEAVANEETAEEPAEEEAQEEAAEEAAPALKAADNGEEQAAEFAYDSGSGTEADPGVISKAETLAAFATEVDNGNHTTDYVKLGADIDLSDIENWNPIGAESGRDNVFNGSFDGAGHKVKGMKIGTYDSSWMSAGLFSTLGGKAKVFDLNVDNVNVSVDVPEAAMYARVGAVTGWIVGGSASIENVKTSGAISVSSNGTSVYAAGIAGNMLAGASVVNCSSDVDISVIESGSSWGMGVGGIAGSSGNSNIISNCAATGDVSVACEKVAGTIGGIAGMASGVVVNSYVSGSVTYSGAESYATGAVIGEVGNGTGKQAVEHVYYASDATSLNAVGKNDNEGITADTTGMAAADMAGDTFASTLNKNLADAIEVTGRSLNKWVVSDSKAVPEGVACSYYDWLSLYNTKLGLNVSNENKEYDAVTSATKFASNHAGDIPTPVVKNDTPALTGVVIPASDDVSKEIKAASTLRTVYDSSFTDNKRYGTDKFTVYLDTTVEGYDFTDYRQNIYAVTVSDGTTTVGAVPWIDFYVQKGHENYVDVALNCGAVHTGVKNEATVHRFDSFYTDGVLNTGTYTVTIYAVGYQPLSADVAVKPVSDASVTATFNNSKELKIEGLPEDAGTALVTVNADKGKTVLVTSAELTDGVVALENAAAFDKEYKVNIATEKYADINITATFLSEEKAQAVVDEAEQKVADAQKAFEALDLTTASASDIQTAYEALVAAQNALTAAQSALTAAQEQKLNDQITELTEQLAEATVVDISNFAVTLDGVEGYSATYTGKAIEPAVAVAGVDADKYTVAYANNTNAGEATVTITATDEAYKGTITKTFKINKAANGLNVKATAKKVKVKKVKKKKQTVAPLSVSGQQGKVTYKKASGNKKLTVASNGKVSVKKGTKKGTYKAVVAVTAAGDANHAAATKKVTVVVKVK